MLGHDNQIATNLESHDRLYREVGVLGPNIMFIIAVQYNLINHDQITPSKQHNLEIVGLHMLTVVTYDT